MDGTSWLLGAIAGFFVARLSDRQHRRKEDSPVIPLYTKTERGHLFSEAARTLSQNSFPRSGVGHEGECPPSGRSEITNK